MIKVFYGDDRVRAEKEIKRLLGKDYEIIDSEPLTPADLPNIFYGTSLFSAERHILLRDFTTNKAVFEQLPNYLVTPHTIVLFETKLDKRSTTYKDLKDKLEFTEFKLPPDPNLNLVFNIFSTAKTNGPRAIQMLSRLKPTEDPIKFTGLLVSQAIKDFSMKQGTKERRVLKALSKLDLQMKSTKIDPWLLVESFLLNLSTI